MSSRNGVWLSGAVENINYGPAKRNIRTLDIGEPRKALELVGL